MMLFLDPLDTTLMRLVSALLCVQMIHIDLSTFFVH